MQIKEKKSNSGEFVALSEKMSLQTIILYYNILIRTILFLKTMISYTSTPSTRMLHSVEG